MCCVIGRFRSQHICTPKIELLFCVAFAQGYLLARLSLPIILDMLFRQATRHAFVLSLDKSSHVWPRKGFCLWWQQLFEHYFGTVAAHVLSRSCSNGVKWFSNSSSRARCTHSSSGHLHEWWISTCSCFWVQSWQFLSQCAHHVYIAAAHCAHSSTCSNMLFSAWNAPLSQSWHLQIQGSELICVMSKEWSRIETKYRVLLHFVVWARPLQTTAMYMLLASTRLLH